MGPTGDYVRDIQLHPSLRCNLRCAHCYSSSSPEATPALAIDSMATLLAEAAEEDFNAISVSGGEPLIYPALLLTVGVGAVTNSPAAAAVPWLIV